MTNDWQRMLAIVLLALLGAGIIWIMLEFIWSDGELTQDDAGWLTAGFLSLREIFSKIEKIALGVRTPAPPSEPVGE